MKKLIAILLFAAPCFAAGPKYIGTKTDADITQEFQNVYQDLKSPNIDVGIASTMTVTYLNVGSMTVNGVNYGGSSTVFTTTITAPGIGTTGSSTFSLLTNSVVAQQISAAGEITRPLQPSFLAVDGTGATNVTGDGTTYSELWPTEIYDQNSDFASNTFTAPITGRYHLTLCLEVTDMTASSALRSITIVTSNRNYSHATSYALAQAALTTCLSVIADMDTSDTATATVRLTGTTKVISVPGSVTANVFSGSLIN